MKPRGYKVGLGLALVVCLVLSLFATLHSKGQWRAQILLWKLEGVLPELSWLQVAAGMIPKQWAGKAEPLVAGRVTFRERGEPPCPVLWATPLGEFWGRLGDESLLEYLLQEQLQEQLYQNDLVRVTSGSVVIDAGAHLGTFVRAALEEGAAKVVAFEPEPVNASCLKKTFSDEILDGRVVLIEAALWDRAGTVNFSANHGEMASGRGRVVEDSSVTVAATTLDDAARDLGLQRVDFIKMDIEGAERRALEGGRQTLARFRSRMVLCLYHRSDDHEVVPRLVLDIQPDYQFVRRSKVGYFF